MMNGGNRRFDQYRIAYSIMLNADGNDFDTRWNVNQVDLNRNYDHYWNTVQRLSRG